MPLYSGFCKKRWEIVLVCARNQYIIKELKQKTKTTKKQTNYIMNYIYS